jgi:hypothetical protein
VGIDWRVKQIDRDLSDSGLVNLSAKPSIDLKKRIGGCEGAVICAVPPPPPTLA